MPRYHHHPATAAEPPGEYSVTSSHLVPCNNCGQKFLSSRLLTHERNCRGQGRGVQSGAGGTYVKVQTYVKVDEYIQVDAAGQPTEIGDWYRVANPKYWEQRVSGSLPYYWANRHTKAVTWDTPLPGAARPYAAASAASSSASSAYASSRRAAPSQPPRGGYSDSTMSLAATVKPFRDSSGMGGGGANKETVISQTRRRIAPGRTTGRVVRDVAPADPGYVLHGSTKASRLREARSAQLRQHHEDHEQEVRE